MPNLMQLRIAAREIFDETLRAVDPAQALHQVVRIAGSQLSISSITTDIGSRLVYSVAIGKAAVPMAYALEQTLGDFFAAGFMSASFPRADKLGLSSMHQWTPRTRWRWCEGGHPLPTRASLVAASESFALLDRAEQDRALVIFLISGGGSAMMEWPVHEDISLADLRTANKVLVNCGASISEINSVRRTFSAVKGGKLAARAPNCDQITLIVSDVPEGEERNVASGPTLAPPDNAPNAREVVARYNLSSQLPATIAQAIQNSQVIDPTSDAMREHFVLLSNADALQAAAAAARSRGYITEIASDISDEPIEDGCDLLLRRLDAVRTRHMEARYRLEAGLVPPVGTSADSKQNGSAICLISGGEFACPVQGDGIGGRNLETALRLACTTNLSLSDTVALCAGTDGVDGNSPAAGAIVDSTTMDRANKIGLDAEDFLRRSDAYSFFVALGDVVATGATGTNVRDVRILISDVDNNRRRET